MPGTDKRFSYEALFNILALSADATGIYTGEELYIQSANDTLLRLWGKGKSVIGKTIEQALPELEGQPFVEILKNVWRTGKTYSGKDVKATLEVDGKLQTFYFDFEYRAILDNEGKTYCILHTTSDVSERIANRKKLEEKEQGERALNEELSAANEELYSSNEELAAMNEELSSVNEELRLSYKNTQQLNKELRLSEQRTKFLIKDAPVAIAVYNSPDLVIESANKITLATWNKGPDVIGKLLEDALPELIGQPFISTLKNIFKTGEPYTGVEEEAQLEKDGVLRTGYFNFVYQPIKTEDGVVTSIFEVVTEVTDQVLARQQLELSELRFKNIVQTTPIGLAVFNGPDFIIETANQTVLDIWGRTLEQVTGKGLIEVFPELKGQPFPDYLRSVLDTGKPVSFPEIPVDVNQPDGTINSIYVDFSYDPIFDIGGKVVSILVSVNDISSAVASRKKIQEQQQELEAINEELTASNEEVRLGNEELQENQDKLLALNAELKKSEDNLRLTGEAANLGVWNLETGKEDVYVNQRCRQLYGLPETGKVTVIDILSRFDIEFLPLAQKALNDAIEYDIPCDVQYSITNPFTQEHKWLRSVGRTFFDIEKQSKWFYGAVQDITEQKKDEQRKNDFIGMVSHELKTPLTSLNAYLQMLQMRAGKAGDEKTLGALNKSVKQIKKMTAMINGFLNVSRLESGKIYIDKHPFDMAQLGHEVEEETAATISSHNIIFEQIEPVSVTADRDKIGQVMNNFISNAVKYSPLGSNINISCTTADSCIIISVSDEGMGIDPKDQEKLFERYYRVEGKHMTTISGFGIGLYLCAQIIHRHNGSIGVESQIGKGSRFWFSIPLS